MRPARIAGLTTETIKPEAVGRTPPMKVGKSQLPPKKKKKKKKTSSTRNRSSAKYWFPRPPHSPSPPEMEGYAVVAFFWEKILGEQATTDKSNEYVRGGEWAQ